MILGADGRPVQASQLSPHLRQQYSIPFGEVRDWRKVGRAVYHDTPHPLHPWDSEAVRLFREEVDATMVPLWVRNTYRNVAGGVYVFDRHVITAYDANRRKVHPDLRSITAISGGHSPNWIVEILGDRGGVLPGPFVAFGMLHYYKYKELTEIANHENIDENHRAYIQGRLNKIKAIDKYYEEESDYRWNQDWGYLKHQAQQLTTEERDLLLNSRPALPGVH